MQWSKPWTPPAAHPGWKLNTDGAARGKPGQAGVGAVVRDADGHVLYILSKSIGIQHSMTAQVCAISEALSAMIKHHGFPLPQIEVESDSKTAIAYISEPSGAPWHLHNEVTTILNIATHSNAIKFSHVPCEANTLADMFAKLGAGQFQEINEWS